MGSTMVKSSGNFLDVLPTQGTMHVVMLGLDSAGKTTALYRLKFDQYLNTVPTIGFNCEKVQGTLGKAKGIHFLVWDVGGQEKLRPLWRSYTRCTDGILFVVDSVDVERMEEAKMELMRTAKCPDNQGVPVLILANKQDLPGARDPKELEKLLGLYELQCPGNSFAVTSSSTGNIVGTSKNNTSEAKISFHENTPNISGRCLIQSSQHYKAIGTTYSAHQTTVPSVHTSTSSLLIEHNIEGPVFENEQDYQLPSVADNSFLDKPQPALIRHSKKFVQKNTIFNPHQYKGWFIQPACAITGEGLQEGLEALFEMIVKKRKLNKAHKKKR